MSIDVHEATAALDDIDTMRRRVRQSRIYRKTSAIIAVWGGLTFIGYVATYAAPRLAIVAWPLVYTVGVGATLLIGVADRDKAKSRALEIKLLAAFVILVAFGLLWSRCFAHFPPRALSAFWPTYFMLAYTLAGLWLGAAFMVIGLGVTALTVLGFLVAGDVFDLWMAVVNGGGLVLGGLWMRRG
jgi:predicted neutral ceramidase superfamily lipid hydrolase